MKSLKNLLTFVLFFILLHSCSEEKSRIKIILKPDSPEFQDIINNLAETYSLENECEILTEWNDIYKLKKSDEAKIIEIDYDDYERLYSDSLISDFKLNKFSNLIPWKNLYYFAFVNDSVLRKNNIESIDEYKQMINSSLDFFDNDKYFFYSAISDRNFAWNEMEAILYSYDTLYSTWNEYSKIVNENTNNFLYEYNQLLEMSYFGTKIYAENTISQNETALIISDLNFARKVKNENIKAQNISKFFSNQKRDLMRKRVLVCNFGNADTNLVLNLLSSIIHDSTSYKLLKKSRDSYHFALPEIYSLAVLKKNNPCLSDVNFDYFSSPQYNRYWYFIRRYLVSETDDFAKGKKSIWSIFTDNHDRMKKFLKAKERKIVLKKNILSNK